MFPIEFSFDREATRFVAIFAGVTFILGLVSPHLGWIGFILTCGCAYFFRDPERAIPEDPNAIISPADGCIVDIGTYSPPEELGLGTETLRRISIFLSVFDVHVNRSPVAGVVEKIAYIPGKFFNATLNKASEHNEREAVLLRTPDGDSVIYVRIAGMIARRIRRDVCEGESLKAGQRTGIIRFGSRVDVYLPEAATLTVKKGQTTIAGETLLAHFPLGSVS